MTRIGEHRKSAFLLSHVVYVVIITAVFLLAACREKSNQGPFVYADDQEARWSSPENRNGVKGAGGKENNGAKGHPYDTIGAGQSLELLNVEQSGIVNRIWITINDRSPEMLRALRIDMYWDNETKPAVSVPFGDFFGVGLGKTIPFQNVYFANPEGRSFNSFIQMPFKKAARIVVTNESSKRLNNIFFDVDYSLVKKWDDDVMYFHAYWHRDTATVLAKDYEILPEIHGRGRYLGVNIGVQAPEAYGKSWFGEGEVKIYLNGDNDLPTLNGTGTEDYIGTAWGQGQFINNYTGCTIADDSLHQWSFYRFHVPDPIFFKTDCRVTIQQLGGDMTDNVARYQQRNAPLIPVTTDNGKLIHHYQKGDVYHAGDATAAKGWTNFYRSDDVSSVAYFYLENPVSELPLLQSKVIRTYKLRSR